MVSFRLYDKDPDLNPDEVLQKAADYEYDVFGNRIQKQVDNDGNSTIDFENHYSLDGWKPGSGFVGTENWDTWGEFSDTGSLATRYIHGDIIDQLFARIESNGDPYWLLADRLGSIRDVTDNSGTVKDSIAYDGFGNIISESNALYRGWYTFTGRQYDAETELLYYRARYYDPSIGRWTSQDPLGFNAGDSNLYRYVHNQPTRHVDPSGLQYPQSNYGGSGLGGFNFGGGGYGGHGGSPGSGNIIYPNSPSPFHPGGGSNGIQIDQHLAQSQQYYYDLLRQDLQKQWKENQRPIILAYRDSDQSPIKVLAKSTYGALKGVADALEQAGKNVPVCMAWKALSVIGNTLQVTLGAALIASPTGGFGQAIGAYMVFRGIDGLAGDFLGERPTSKFVKGIATLTGSQDPNKVAAFAEFAMTIGDILAGFAIPPINQIPRLAITRLVPATVPSTVRGYGVSNQLINYMRGITNFRISLTVAGAWTVNQARFNVLKNLNIAWSSIRLGGQILFMAMNGTPEEPGGQNNGDAALGAPIVTQQGGRQILQGISNGTGGRLPTNEAIPHIIAWLRLGGRRDATVGTRAQAEQVRIGVAPNARPTETYSENTGSAIYQLHPAEPPANPLPHIRLWDGQGGSFHIFYSH